MAGSQACRTSGRRGTFFFWQLSRRPPPTGLEPILGGAHTVMAYVVMAYVVMACVLMADVVMACVVMACVVMADVVMAYVVMAYVVMACVVMADDRRRLVETLGPTAAPRTREPLGGFAIRHSDRRRHRQYRPSPTAVLLHWHGRARAQDDEELGGSSANGA